MRKRIPLEKAYLLLNHGPTVLVTATADGRTNIMAAAWTMAIDFDPPKIAIVIDSKSHTRHLIERSGEFVLSLPSAAQADLTLSVGGHSGKDVDKIKAFSIATSPASKVGTFLVDGCLGWLECKVIFEPRLKKEYDLILAEVVAASAESDVFGENGWTFSKPGVSTIHHLSDATFAVLTKTIRAKKLPLK